MSSDYTAGRDADDLKQAQICALANSLVGQCPDDMTPAEVLQALLGAYMAVARANPAVTRIAARAAFTAAGRLHLAVYDRPAGTPTH